MPRVALRLSNRRRRGAAVLLASVAAHAAAAQAPTGDAADAVDLFGPVFADGLWPRPIRVRREPCDPNDVTPHGADCRRDLMLARLAAP